MITRHTFDVRRGAASYQVECSKCGKTLNRTATAEHTINPFNRNEDGSIRTASEVSARANEEARRLAEELAAKPAICRDCEEAPVRALLVEMAAEPERIFVRPEPFWGSPMHTLDERKQVERAYERCDCGSPCCSRYRDMGGYRLTIDGKRRAAKLVPAS